MSYPYGSAYYPSYPGYPAAGQPHPTAVALGAVGGGLPPMMPYRSSLIGPGMPPFAPHMSYPPGGMMPPMGPQMAYPPGAYPMGYIAPPQFGAHDRNGQVRAYMMQTSDRIFQMHDRNFSGYLDVHEIQPAVAQLYMLCGMPAPPGYQVLEIMRSFDRDHNGLLDVHEFRNLVAQLAARF